MAVLVTGGAGYIGSHIVIELIAAGETVVVLDDLSTGHAEAVPNPAILIRGDVADENLLKIIFKENDITGILHLAGKTIVPESFKNPLTYYLNNSYKSAVLLKCSIESGVPHFLFSSTAAVYGAPSQNPINELDPTNPISPYGFSKLMTELILNDCAIAHNFKFVILRYFNVAGADPRGRSGQSSSSATHLIKAAIQCSLGTRESIQIFGTDYSTPDGSCIRDYIHVSDLARAHIEALSYLRRGGSSQVVNCGYGHGYSVIDVINAIRSVSGINFKSEVTSRRVGDSAIVVADNSKIKSLFNWSPVYDNLDDIINHSLSWERYLLNSRG